MEPLQEYPEESDLVVCTVKSVRNFGAFVELEEYPGKEGFIHVAEIATGWVKRMSDYVRDGQRIVCKVMRVQESKGHIDLSLKKVNAHQKREKIQDWKNEQKATKLLEIVVDRIPIDMNEFRQKHTPKLLEEYGSLYVAFEEAASEEGLGKFKGKWVSEFEAVARENVTAPSATVDGVIELSCPGPDGIKCIKGALIAAEKHGKGGVTVQYMGAPKYRITATEAEYKAAEELIRSAAEQAIKQIEKDGGTGKFERGT